ncbi:hypothetical protein FXO37_26620 [Capsicum annuum]|nr:hypothetical protein FXO37_26620 [Capsicum annuum]
MKFFKNQSGMHLLFHFLVTKLCKRNGVVEYFRDTWVHPRALIYPLKILGEGASGKSKKKKIELGKLTCEDIESCRSSTASPFEQIGVDLRMIREYVLRFTQGSEGSTTTLHLYVVQRDYEMYLVE